MSPEIRVILVDGMALYACALQATLSAQPDMVVVAVVGGHDQVTRALAATRPDVALVDLDTTDGDRIAASRRLGEVAPACRRIALSTGPLPGPLLAQIRAQAHGVVSKHSATSVLLDAVRQVNAGLEIVDPRFTSVGRPRVEALTQRELDLLSRAAHGSSIAELANQLVLSEGTVRNYLSRVAAKLGARSRLEAICIVREAGWL
jgi:two-component system, NarL family, response regulator DesR